MFILIPATNEPASYFFFSYDLVNIVYVERNNFFEIFREGNLLQCLGISGWCIMGHACGQSLPALP